MSFPNPYKRGPPQGPQRGPQRMKAPRYSNPAEWCGSYQGGYPQTDYNFDYRSPPSAYQQQWDLGADSMSFQSGFNNQGFGGPTNFNAPTNFGGPKFSGPTKFSGFGGPNQGFQRGTGNFGWRQKFLQKKKKKNPGQSQSNAPNHPGQSQSNAPNQQPNKAKKIKRQYHDKVYIHKGKKKVKTLHPEFEERQRYKEKKLLNRMEQSFEVKYDLPPHLRTVLDEELKKIKEIVEGALPTPKEGDAVDEAMVEALKGEGTEGFLKQLDLLVTKRLMNVKTSIILRAYGHPKLPPKPLFEETLKDYNLDFVKKSVNNFFVVHLKDYESYDRLCDMETMTIGGNQVKFKPFQLAGPNRVFISKSKKMVPIGGSTFLLCKSVIL